MSARFPIRTSLAGSVAILVALCSGAKADASSTARFAPIADAYTSVSSPRANYGRAKWLRIDGRPRRQAYMRFRVRNLTSRVERATLRLRVRSSGRTRLTVRSVKRRSWREHRVNHRHRLSASRTVARSTIRRGRRWVSLNVTSAVKGNGTLTVALLTRSSRGFSIASRDGSPKRAPRLIVKTATTPGANQIGGKKPTGPAADHGDLGYFPAPFLRRPYRNSSPWNTRIRANPRVNPASSGAVSLIGGPITSDTGQYTYPLYFVDSSTPVRQVRLSGVYSNVTGTATADTTLTLTSGSQTINVPARDEFSAADGTDGQIIIVNPATGDEWGFWQLEKSSGGQWSATNGYHYNVYWDGHPPRSSSNGAFGSRGAGVTYYSGLVRPFEIARGRIDHALAFAFNWPAGSWIYPAAKSDGASGAGLPQGARLQLDPAMTDDQLRAAGCSPAAITMAHAMQEYGMYVIDNSGSDKVMLEHHNTADWGSLGVNRNTASCIPLSRIRWID